MIIGFVTIATGLVLLAIHPLGVSPYLWLAIGAAITGVGIGGAQPAANNAMLQLAPTEVSAVAGLRGMIRQSGAIAAVSITTAIATRSAHAGLAIADVYLVCAALFVVSIALILRVPDHHGTW
jgi:MFS family permease